MGQDSGTVCETVEGNAGVWVAYYLDKSACVPFATELDALRFAVDRSMSVRFVRFGETV